MGITPGIRPKYFAPRDARYSAGETGDRPPSAFTRNGNGASSLGTARTIAPTRHAEDRVIRPRVDSASPHPVAIRASFGNA